MLNLHLALCICSKRSKSKFVSEDQILRIYKEGERRVNKQFDAMKLLRNLKTVKILSKFMLKPNRKTNIDIMTCKKLIIDCQNPLYQSFSYNKVDRFHEIMQKKKKHKYYYENESSESEESAKDPVPLIEQSKQKRDSTDTNKKRTSTEEQSSSSFSKSSIDTKQKNNHKSENVVEQQDPRQMKQKKRQPI